MHDGIRKISSDRAIANNSESATVMTLVTQPNYNNKSIDIVQIINYANNM